ncbi:LacI family DNA-binding transcriptional regulator [Streptomyces sp. NPDC048243]|uniref:LacI family DNA-binding transcriptional regulator n=1 Tax=Streptomyces sp. NPDC048243 TaxID=3365522 RepID=UPI0037231621
MAQRVTLHDVARAAGVSSATVSYVLSGKRPVTDATRRSVEAAIDRFRLAADAFEAIRGAGIPVVVSADTAFCDVDLVTPDAEGAVVDAMTHLAASGRRSRHGAPRCHRR